MIWLQVITVLFSIACAWLNKWPVIIFRATVQKGHKSEKEFHAANAAVKVVWAAIPFFTAPLNWFTIVYSALLLLIQYLVFDPALNVFTGKKWYYLGQTAFLDKLVRNGKIKASVVASLIIALNILLWQKNI